MKKAKQEPEPIPEKVVKEAKVKINFDWTFVLDHPVPLSELNPALAELADAVELSAAKVVQLWGDKHGVSMVLNNRQKDYIEETNGDKRTTSENKTY